MSNRVRAGTNAKRSPKTSSRIGYGSLSRSATGLSTTVAGQTIRGEHRAVYSRFKLPHRRSHSRRRSSTASFAATLDRAFQVILVWCTAGARSLHRWVRSPSTRLASLPAGRHRNLG